MNVAAQNIESYDLENLNKEQCKIIDSTLRADPDMPEWQRIAYYDAMQWSHEERGHYMLALYCSDSLIQIYKRQNSNQELADQYRDISMLYDYLGQYPEALGASLKGLDLYLELDDQEGIAGSYNDIGVLHYYDGDYVKSRDYFNKALVIFQELKDTSGISMYYNNTANTLFEEDDLEKALGMYKKALEFDKLVGDFAGQSVAMANIGETYTALGEFDKAEKILLEALVVAENSDDEWAVTNPLRGLGGLYQETGELHKAIRVLEKSVKICAQIDALPEQSENYHLLYLLHKKNGNTEKSLYYYELYNVLDDSIYSMEKERIMNEMEVKYELQDKAKTIDLMTQEQHIEGLEHDKELENEKSKQLLLLFGLLAFGIVIVFAIRGIALKKKANNQLQEQNSIIQNKNLEIQSAYEQIEEKNNEILDSIRYAKRIQSAILPQKSVINEVFPDSFVYYLPKDVVAGDFYWLEERDGTTMLAAADCTGHGVPGAMVSVVCNNGLNRSVRELGITDPGKILDKTREIVLQEFGKSEEKVNDGMDIAICSIKDNKLQFAGAQNPLWIIRKDSREIEEYKGDKQPIGKYPNPSPFTTHELELNPGDTFYLFTDGYADQFGGDKGKKMKTGNFKKLLISLSQRSMGEQKARLESAFDEWKGEIEQLDDLCVIGVRV